MSRRSKPAKRIPLADPVYNSVDISKFINRIMRRGKKSLAEKIFYATLLKIEERTGEKALEIFQKAMTNATPLLEVKQDVSAVQLIRCLSKLRLTEVLHLLLHGLLKQPRNAAENHSLIN